MLKRSGPERDLGQSSLSFLCPKLLISVVDTKDLSDWTPQFPQAVCSSFCTVGWIAVGIEEVLRCQITINFHTVCVKVLICCSMVSFVLPC